MAYKQKVVDCLEALVVAQNSFIKHLARQDIFLMILPKLAVQSSADAHKKLNNLLDRSEAVRTRIERALCRVNEEDRDVY